MFQERNLPFLRQRGLQSPAFLWREHHIQLIIREVSQLPGQLSIQVVEVCHQKSFKVHRLHGVIKLRLQEENQGEGVSHAVRPPPVPAPSLSFQPRHVTCKRLFGGAVRLGSRDTARNKSGHTEQLKSHPKAEFFLRLIAWRCGILRRSAVRWHGFAEFLESLLQKLSEATFYLPKYKGRERTRERFPGAQANSTLLWLSVWASVAFGLRGALHTGSWKHAVQNHS